MPIQLFINKVIDPGCYRTNDGAFTYIPDVNNNA